MSESTPRGKPTASQGAQTLASMDVDVQKAYAALNAMEEIYKVTYFLPHEEQDLRNTSPFGWYSPAIHEAVGPMRIACRLYAVLEATLGVTVQRADLSIRASAADVAVAKVLGLATGAPLLEMARDSFDGEGRWRDHSLFQIRPERYEFSVSSASRVRLGTMKRQSTG